jgi:micrococcal nuclease
MSTLIQSLVNWTQKLRLLLIAFALLFPQGAIADLSGRVVSVADGDTLTILDEARLQHRIRLADIDAPEGGQAYGQRAKQLLASICNNKTASVHVGQTDRYGRTVGTVFCEGVNANSELVRQGLAWVYVRYAPPNSSLYELEADARANKSGLWADENAIAPWEWRHRGKQELGVSSGHDSVRGNRRSMIYHLPHCGGYGQIKLVNRVPFSSEEFAKQDGYRRAKNCP